MEHYPAVLPLLVLAAISALIFLRKAIVGRITQHWPPGPPAWPIIGHLHLLGDLPHQSLCKLSQSYGPLLGLHFGGVPTIIASSAEMAKEILQTHDITFSSRPRIAAARHMGFNCTDVTFSPCGPYWRYVRQLYATELFSSKKIESFRHVRKEEVEALVHGVLGEGGHGDRKVEMRPLITMALNNIICRMVMGKKITEVCGKDVKLELVNLLEETAYLTGVFYVGDYIPWLAWLDPYGYLKRMKVAAQKFRAILQHVIDMRREEHMQHKKLQPEQAESPPPQDFLDAMLTASPPKDLQLTDDNIMAAILDLFLGGSDTPGVTVEWAMADLINNPKVMLKVQEEVDGIVGKGRVVEEGDIVNLPYLGCVIKESMRLHPITPLLVPREGVQECQIGCYKIFAKTRAYVNVWAIQRDPLTWDQPLEFRPERFDDKKIDLRGNNFELLPFGIGRRKCPGWVLGFLNVHLMIASLVQAFTWSIETPNAQNHASHSLMLDMSEKFGLGLIMEKPLCVFATPRLPLNLYQKIL